MNSSEVLYKAADYVLKNGIAKGKPSHGKRKDILAVIVHYTDNNDESERIAKFVKRVLGGGILSFNDHNTTTRKDIYSLLMIAGDIASYFESKNRSIAYYRP